VPRSDAELAIAAALAGGAVVRGKYGSTLTRFDKSSLDFATDADLEAESAIVEVLRAERPDDAVLGEEHGASGAAGARRTWLVDPICGTLNFAARTPLVAVNVALRSQDEVTAAAVADPFAAEVFWSDGSEANRRHEGIDERLVPSGGSRLVDLNLDSPFPNGARFRAADLLTDDGFIASFGPRVLSTTLALAWLAAGRHAAYITDGHLRDSVHFAAGLGLCRAAGCVLTNLDGGPLHTGSGGLIAAADAETHAALLTLVADHALGARPRAEP
jgi:myo-inositol-1(or 4)-monophosphatase